jgi:exonuclease VII large subunit
MFDNQIFEDWLDAQARKAMDKIGNGESIAPEQMTILVLKAQTNHFAHLDVELREDMKSLDGRLSRDMQSMNERLSREMQTLNERLSTEMRALRDDMDKRFEQMQLETAKRFEQVDKRFEQMQLETAKRFEQVDKRFEQLTSRIDHFMIWSFATTISVGGMIVAAIKFL